MALPTFDPVSQTSAIILPSASLASEAEMFTFPFDTYTDNQYFLSGAADQVAYTYNKLGGTSLDIEISKEVVYTAYQDAVLEYSYIVNLHQAKNALPNLLGAKTGSFNEEGQLNDTTNLVDVALKYPKFRFGYAKRVMYGVSTEAGFGGVTTIYSASFSTRDGIQDYDLQHIISSSAVSDPTRDFYNKIGNKKINITRVYYKSPRAMWRFFGYYGGLTAVGNLTSYGQYADDSTFELVPAWQNKLQAINFEDIINTRLSHYSYEIKNNIIRLFPIPRDTGVDFFWVEFYVEDDTPWEETPGVESGVEGINNLNTLPFENIPFQNINSIGKHWIRRFALALSKETLGNVRSKLSSIPIPNNSVTLDGPALISQGTSEQEKLKEELKKILDELTYNKIATTEAETMKAINEAQEKVPLLVYVG